MFADVCMILSLCCNANGAETKASAVIKPLDDDHDVIDEPWPK